MRVIKLTESDLRKIVKKVLNEQLIPSNDSINFTPDTLRFNANKSLGIKPNINPKNLKLGDGGKTSPEKRNDVIVLQQKLIDLGILKTKTGKPTGFFGSLTDAALKKYDPKTSTQKSTTTTTAPKTATTSAAIAQSGKESSFLDKAAEFCSSPFKRLSDFVKSFDMASISPLPPHLRAFMSFLVGRTEPIKANFFKPEEIKIITDRVNSYFPNNANCKRNKKCYVSFYQNTDWSKVKSGQEKVVNPDLAKAIGLTIGNGQVIDNGNSYIVKDIYDFNNFKNNPDAYSPEKAGTTIKNALKKISCGNYIQGVEELASFKQAKGYNGIPVEIEIPKNKA